MLGTVPGLIRRMPQDAMMEALPRTIEGWRPSTFVERGVVVPFTTPQLAGARLRRTERGILELILPEVCGPGSVGILPWEQVSDVCVPTLFDRSVGARLVLVSRLGSAELWQAICVEARAGLAGVEVQAAAAMAEAAKEGARVRARGELEAVIGRGMEGDMPEGSVPAAILDELAALFGPIGLGAEANAAILPRTIAAVGALIGEIGDPRAAGGLPGQARLGHAELVRATAQAVAAAATASLMAARTLTLDLRLLLRRWTIKRPIILDELGRAERLLNGWAWLCQLWAAPDERIPYGVRLAQLAALLPPLPHDSGVRAAAPPPADMPQAVRDMLRGVDWRNGLTRQDLIARNERLLAATLAMAG